MGSLCTRVERALVAWIKGGLGEGTLDSTRRIQTDLGSLIITDTGLHIATTRGSEFDVFIQVGETEDEILLPCIIAVCETASEEDPWTGNHNADAYVDVRFPGDSYADKPDIVAALEEVSLAVQGLLYRDDLPFQLSFREGLFTCQGVIHRSMQRAVDGRVRIHRYLLSLYCCTSDLLTDLETVNA